MCVFKKVTRTSKTEYKKDAFEARKHSEKHASSGDTCGLTHILISSFLEQENGFVGFFLP